MKLFSKIWYWLVVMVVLILAAGITTLFPQTNDVPVSEETQLPDTPNKVDSVPKVEPQQEVPASSSPDVNIDSSNKVELQQLFNDLRKEYLDTRAESVNWWLQFITIVLAFFGIVVVVLGYFGLQEFKKLKAEAEKDADEIKDHLFEVMKSREAFERAREEAENSEVKAESNEAMQRTRETFSAEEFATLTNDEEFEKVLRDFEQIPNLSFIDKATVEAYKLQKDGKITEAIQKWHSIANIVGETDKNLAARAWSSAGYLLSEQERTEDAISAYDKAIEMRADYAEAYYKRGTQRISLKQYLLAMNDFDQAIKLNFNAANVYVGRGITRLELGKRDDAFIDFNNAISIDPNYASAYAIRGEAKVSENDIAGAKSDFQYALNLAGKQGKNELRVTIEERLQELTEME